MHYEFLGPRRSPHVDSVQFHVSSSLGKAEKYVREHGVESHSWWQVHSHLVDDPSHREGEEVYYYSHRGTRLKTDPWKRARAAFDRLPDSRIGP
jgi:hypothetical protein